VTRAANTNGRQSFDGREMVAVHDMLRREFALIPGLVAGVTAGDHDRAQIVGDHIEALITVLHHHHRIEDEYVWPLLLNRCAESVAPLVGLLKHQHERVATLGHAIDEALSVWRHNATVESRGALVDSLNRLTLPLTEHLSDEEDGVVPLVEQHITADEWNEMVAKGAADADPEEWLLGFGMLMYEGDPGIIDRAIANMPADTRPVIRQLAPQAFADHSMRVHGTATPPRSTELRLPPASTVRS
jgi:hemerythrin-like domain-containing protein